MNHDQMDRFNVGDKVTVEGGAFNAFDGVVIEIDESGDSAFVEINVYGKGQSVMLDIARLRKR